MNSSHKNFGLGAPSFSFDAPARSRGLERRRLGADELRLRQPDLGRAGRRSASTNAWSAGCLVLGLLGLACSEAGPGASTREHVQALTQIRIEGEAFNRFSDSDSAHQGNCGSGPVDAEVTSDPEGGQCNIGWTVSGEWLEYDVEIAESGNYDLAFRVASAQAGRTLRLEVDGADVTGSVVAPSSGWQAFEDRVASGIALSAGQHVFRIVFETGALNLNYFDLVQQGSAGEVILDARFDTSEDGFNFTDQGAYEYVDGAARNGRLEMTLGGIDNTAVLDMRGLFHRAFWVSTSQEVILRFDYTLEQSCTYESDEWSEVWADLDGIPLGNGAPHLAHVQGNGNACPGATASGTFVGSFALSQGKHHLQIHGLNNKKTASDEVTTLSIDNVSIIGTGASCSEPLSQAYQNLCNACGGMLDCEGTCTATVAPDVGAACGSCGGVVDCDGSCTEPLTAPCGAPPTAQERHEACAKDPRVVAGLLPRDVCTGADIFFRETFQGNGRTCGSCHPVANNYTIDPLFVQALQAENPNDPLFVARVGTALEHLETEALLTDALILENIDGFQDPENRFVSRSVPHLFSLARTLAPDPADGSTTPPLERTGWSGDGAPGDGSLNAFIDGAVTQHLTKSLSRVSGVDFRPPTQFERDVVESFELALGRQNELDLDQVIFSLQDAEDGKGRFQDPAEGRCGVCHSNAGATFVNSGLNRNFNNGIGPAASPGRLPDFFGPGEDMILADGGFGGADLAEPNVDPTGIGFNNAFGDGNFNVPSLIEAADTAPFFHGNQAVGRPFLTTMGNVMFFYGTTFQFSTGSQFLESQPEFGPNNISAGTTAGIAPMLVVLNAVFNIDIARQRLAAAQTLAVDLREIRADVQAELMLLAGEEIEDAIRVLDDEGIHSAERDTLQVAFNLVRTANAGEPWNDRLADISSALTILEGVRPLFGENFDYQLGPGTLMY